MRLYRSRLRAQGVRPASIRDHDPWLRALSFRDAPLLTPGEQDVLSRFVDGLRRIAPAAQSVRLFGSRARGDSTADSDLDVAVVFEALPDARLLARLSDLALRARAPYDDAGHPIVLRPVGLDRTADASFLIANRTELRTLWTRPPARQQSPVRSTQPSRQSGRR